MPGITGMISPNAARNGNELEQMLNCMMHESFYASGTYINAELELCAGWTCFRDGYADCVPIWNEQRNICLIFSGEHYPDNGPTFDGSSLLDLYEQFGLDFLEKLNGLFSGILADLRERKVVLFNDRYGLNRIYYHESSRGFYFSSEAKSLLKVLPETRCFDFASLGEFFSCGCALQNRSLFSGVSLVPAGAMWTFSPGRPPKKETYFDKATWENQPLLTDKNYSECLEATFARVLARYAADKPLGISLTGGVDSRMVMAWAKRPAGTLPCYTFGGRYRESIDVKVAREVAKICDQPHQVIPVGREFLAEFPALAEKTVYVTDGAMDVSGSADLFVNRVARKIAPIRLTGNYGGEILRRLVAFKPMPSDKAVFEPEFADSVYRARGTYAQELKDHPLSFVAFKQVPWHHFSRLSLERSQIVMRSPYLDNDLVKLVYQAPAELASSNELSLKMIADGNPRLGRIATDRGVTFQSFLGLSKVHHLFQQFTFKAEYAYDYGMPQRLARIDHLFAPFHLEKLFLGRHKFQHFRVWYRDELSAYVREILLDSRTRNRPYLQGARLETMVNRHIKGDQNYTLELHRILTAELVERHLIEQTGQDQKLNQGGLRASNVDQPEGRFARIDPR